MEPLLSCLNAHGVGIQSHENNFVLLHVSSVFAIFCHIFEDIIQIIETFV